jgi:hypothetical protein
MFIVAAVIAVAWPVAADDLIRPDPKLNPAIRCR